MIPGVSLQNSFILMSQSRLAFPPTIRISSSGFMIPLSMSGPMGLWVIYRYRMLRSGERAVGP
jgi:hypothetical protein